MLGSKAADLSFRDRIDGAWPGADGTPFIIDLILKFGRVGESVALSPDIAHGDAVFARAAARAGWLRGQRCWWTKCCPENPCGNGC